MKSSGTGMNPIILILSIFLLSHNSFVFAVLFQSVKQCPTANAKLHQQKLSSKIKCAAICTNVVSCNRFYFDPVTKSCHLGDACSMLNQWVAGDCNSYDYIEQLSSDDTERKRKVFLEQLQMKIFYKFKSSGLMNEVNPRQFCLSANNVAVDSNGAHFGGNRGSYLSTETPGFEQFLDYGNVYSFYVKVRHANNRQTVYHRFMQCSTPFSMGNNFIKDTSPYVHSTAYWTKGGMQSIYSKSQNFITPNGETMLLSVGYAYNRTAHQHFYSSFNPTLLPAIPSLSSPGSTSASNFQCVRLGYHSLLDTSCLNGTMYCYGLSSKILNFDDYKLLDAYCDA